MASTTTELAADGFLSVAAAAKFLSISRTTLYQLMGSQELPYALIGRNRRIPRVALNHYLSKQFRGGLDGCPIVRSDTN